MMVVLGAGARSHVFACTYEYSYPYKIINHID